MGFLSGVLKGVSEKQPYKVGKETLKTLVSDVINNHLCSGHEGFKKLFEKLPERIAAYNRDVQQGNDRVKRPIKKLQDEMKELKNQVSNILKDNAVAGDSTEVEKATSKAESLAIHCKTFAEKFYNESHRVEEHIADLNNDCRTKLHSARKNITHEGRRLVELSEKERLDLEGMNLLMGDALRSFGEDVSYEVQKNVRDLIDKLTTKVLHIKIQLLDIYKKLGQYANDLTEWMRIAKITINSADKHVERIINKEVGLDIQVKIKKTAMDMTAWQGRLNDYMEKDVKPELHKLTKAALTAVVEMDKNLKEDLWKVKMKIKNAMWDEIKALQVKTLDDFVKKDLETLKTKINAQLNPIVGSSNEFYRAFKATKEELLQAVNVMKGNLDKLQTLRGFEEIKNTLVAETELLTAIRDDSAFTQLKTYFTKLDEEVMQPIKGAMEKISQHLRHFVGQRNLEDVISTVDGEIKALAGIFEGSVPSADFNDLNSLLGTYSVSVTKINLTSHAGNIDKLLEKLAGQPTHSTRLRKADLIDILKELGAVSQEVSLHSKTVVDEVMGAIQKKVKQEISSIASVLNEKLEHTKQGINVSTDDGKNVDYMGDGKAKDNVRGLQALVVKFERDINKRLGSFQTNIESDIFKKIAGSSIDNNYDLNHIMSSFNSTYSIIKNDLTNKLYQTVEKQLPNVTGDIGQGLSVDLTQHGTGFEKYKEEVNQGTLANAKTDSEKLGGTLPNKIKEINNYSKNILDISQTLTNLESWSNNFTTHIKDLTTELATTGEYINRYLVDLQTSKIEKSLSKIMIKIATVQTGPANDALNAAIRFIEADAETMLGSTINMLKGFVKQRVEYAIIDLTTAARRNYVSSIKALLTAFADKVSQELKGLPGEIDRDRKEGFKGFMRTLQGVMNDNGDTTDANITLLKDVADMAHSTGEEKMKAFMKLSDNFRKFYWWVEEYVKKDIRRRNDEENKKRNPEGQGNDAYVNTFVGVGTALAAFLEHISNENRYDHKVHGLLEDLKTAISAVKPNDFSKPNTPTMDSVAVGLSHFTRELGNVYVSAYDNEKFAGALVDESDNPETSKLTDYGRKCAKVFSTLLEIFKYDLEYLKEECKLRWRDKQLCLKSNADDKNELGHFVRRCGYGVPSKEGEQDDELRCSKYMNGNEIFAKLTVNTITTRDPYNVMSNLSELTDCLAIYYRVCHLPTVTTPKYPSSVYQMLTWLTGLVHNPVYDELGVNGFADLFEKKEEDNAQSAVDSIDVTVEDGVSEPSTISVFHKDDDSLEAYPRTITATTLRNTLADVCAYAHDILTSVLGHGHSAGIYACEFNTNPHQLSYPSDMTSLVCWLYDILRRVHHQLYFLYRQCYHNTECNGWAECYYGRYVAGSSWQCNRMQCPDQTCEQKCKQTCNQIHNQKGDQHPNCGLKSPLQSFLEDGLQGFLPHNVKFEKGKLGCSVKGHFNLPCKTPMGFGNISDIASHTQRGRHIYDALKRLCGDERSPLPKLCGQLSCLLPSAPKTLDDMFGFYYRLLRGWNNPNDKRKEHRETALVGAVKAANFEDSNTVLDITTICKHNEHTVTLPDKKSTHLTGDLYALIDCYTDSSSAPSHPCGRYMRPICHDMCGTFTKENADKYLSWIVYCTGSFLDLLKQLYEECNRNCAGERPKCRISKCKKGCTATELLMSPESIHTESCDSIVNCKFMRPTFYKYGLVLGDCKSLSAKTTKRTCKDLCMVLQNVTNEEESSKHPLAELVYRTIPNFLYQIRFPFMSLTLALWLLSLLYLLHIMVIRLDLLHIKSHLHSPSSHRIAAQSLLAAGRVNKFNTVFYLQP